MLAATAPPVFSENVGPANYFSARKPRPDSGEPADSI